MFCPSNFFSKLFIFIHSTAISLTTTNQQNQTHVKTLASISFFFNFLSYTNCQDLFQKKIFVFRSAVDVIANEIPPCLFYQIEGRRFIFAS